MNSEPCFTGTYPTGLCTKSANSPNCGCSGVEFRIVSGGESHFVASTTDGEVFVWGANTHGQLGLKDTPSTSASGADTAAVFQELSIRRPHTLVTALHVHDRSHSQLPLRCASMQCSRMLHAQSPRLLSMLEGKEQGSESASGHEDREQEWVRGKSPGALQIVSCLLCSPVLRHVSERSGL